MQGVVIIRILQMKKLGLREVESLAQRPTAAKWQSWDLPPTPARNHPVHSIQTWLGFSPDPRGGSGGQRGFLERGKGKEISSKAWPQIPLRQGRSRFPRSGAMSRAEKRAGSHFPGYSSRKLQVPRIAWAFFY